ncbi:hypothetical protein ElyMa_004185700 [Elysia marginata]|uniref:Uncharacterized protein n=1 Tax=Elysia marginata TaxID=1093978 RepID=A0AAV4GK79_9GAST|nr:hypothetical protein ElyMa_004185700 [Elysia marginata]
MLQNSGDAFKTLTKLRLALQERLSSARKTGTIQRAEEAHCSQGDEGLGADIMESLQQPGDGQQEADQRETPAYQVEAIKLKLPPQQIYPKLEVALKAKITTRAPRFDDRTGTDKRQHG